MENIPQDVLYEAFEAGRAEPPYEFLRVVGKHFADRAERTRALRKKSWQSTSRELDGVADHIRAYAEQLEQFGINNINGVALVGGETDPCGALHPHLKSECVHEAGHSGDHGNLTDGDWASSDGTAIGKPLKAARPQLPGNTGRCASFRRATPGDGAVCALERGHDGNHVTEALEAWPRTPSGHVCGDVVILHDGTALNCQRPLGHDGDEHHDGRYQFWPRGVGTSRQVITCERCNRDEHTCPGCGEPIGHYAGDCGKDCTAPALPSVLTEVPIENDAIFPNQCSSRHDGERCMLPGAPMHTGKHKGTKGTAWAQEVTTEAHGLTVTHAAGSTAHIGQTDRGETIVEVTQAMDGGTALHTLADIAEQQRATMVIPEQRAESDPVPAPRLADVLTAEFREEVSATVAELTGDEPIGTTVNVGGIEFVKHSDNPFSALGNPFQVREINIVSNPLPHLAFTPENGYSVTPVLGNPFQAPAPPPAAFLPPHLVPGAPKAHQSHSSITTMEKCGLQYRLKYRDQIGDDTPAWWNVAGTAFHQLVQTIEAAHATSPGYWAPDGNLMEQERAAHAAWKDEFATQVEQTERSSGKARSTWKAAKGGKEGEAFWREYGGDLARMYVAHRRKFLAEPEGWRLLSKPGGEGWAHEVEFNATVDGVPLKGFIDSAWISADGATILIEDFKSGSSEGDPFQPKLYGAALRALGFIDGRRVITRFYEARKGAHSVTVELTPADDAEVSYRANTAQAMDRAGIFPPSPSGYNCSTCPVKSRCPIMATKGN